MFGLHVLFFASGFGALLYQVVWQRTLFALYGINVEAVTIIVTVFMLGLGLGSFLGGLASRVSSANIWRTFGSIELAVGLFGIGSLPLFHRIGAATAQWTQGSIAAVTFAVLLVPTVLMGATLPLLVAYVARVTNEVGAPVSKLYYVNTLGSAVASLLAGLVLLALLGQRGTTHLAATVNLAAAASAFVMASKVEKTAQAEKTKASPSALHPTEP